MSSERIPRRSFLKNSTLAASSIALSSAGVARGFPANEKVVLGVIGIRGRGLGLAQGFSKNGAGIAYLCDVDSNLFADRLKSIASLQGKAPQAVKDYRAILDDGTVDAVVVATPDHWHAPPTIQACQSGKDVYVEKPVAHNVREGRKMIEAARKYKRIVQVGTQARSGPYVQRAAEYIRKRVL
ncbi:MAG TPA: Gfo/Idh/MocA family oxidoreductase [Phycisphaerae bacterium]|nr:Gfo/Idh/MocA family oxidoreductase [Phycisphaerae bacterium]HRY70089.1 Gfo/Idh/MocA family oxidoreductase [Phycisphaerae bacterium]HSA27365.1 Gfo/Idh/MocA family oxidoreductase [Phycisphaerae bacterium]